MTLKFIYLSILILCSFTTQGQYVYFNNLYNTLHPETTSAVELADDGYVTVSGQNLDGDYRVLFRKYSFDGTSSLETGYSSGTDYFYSGGNAALCRLAGTEGFLYCTTMVENANAFGRVYRLDMNLDTLWTTDLNLSPGDDTELLVSQELSDGYLFFGFFQYEVDRDIICVKLDLNGNYQWHFVLEDPVNSHTPLHAYKISESEFLLGGGGFFSNQTLFGWIHKINLSGEVVWSHLYGDAERNDGGISSIFRLPNGNYQLCYVLGVSGDLTYSDTQCKLVEFSDSGNYMPVSEIGFDTYWRHGVLKLIRSNQGQRIFTGGYFNLNETIDSYVESVNVENNVEWMNFYSFNDCETCSNSIWDLEIAPDSGYICTGYFIDYGEEIPINRTWMLKIDACGDVEYNGCPPSVNVKESTHINKGISLWPNPAEEHIYLNADPGQVIRSVRLLSLTGNLIHEYEVGNFNGNYAIDISAIPPGCYLVETTDEKEVRLAFTQMIR